ncbi:MAG: type I DNA topoisomerase [bacterium]
MKSMIIVESKAKTASIGKIVGKGYLVESCLGHVFDLPTNTLGVDIGSGFAPTYVQVKGKGKVVSQLKREAQGVDSVIIATDPDREGESIAWHLARLFPKKKIHRMRFNEITAKAVKEALANLTGIDERLVNAQQARRVLDRLVGYKLSPLLWSVLKKRGLSAGRVQSVALKLICDREREIGNFTPVEYWDIAGVFAPVGGKETFKARFLGTGPRDADKSGDGAEKETGKFKLKNREEAEGHLNELARHAYRVEKVTKKTESRRPFPPFTTSTLQQDAARRLRYTAAHTMSLAQQLYEGLDLGGEGVVGLITYMRTDSTRVSGEAAAEARKFILGRFGKKYLPDRTPVYRRKSASPVQDAHEAIRPTSVFREPDALERRLSKEQRDLYALIWRRFVASQMNPAVTEVTTADIRNGNALFRASGTRVLFDGFSSVYRALKENGEEEEETKLPELRDGMPLRLEEIGAARHFTKPPPRYTEASLIRVLEEKGIGRPSTYVPTIETIRKRRYVEMKNRAFVPSTTGKAVTSLLSENFRDIMDYDFTARMEDELDKVESGEQPWVSVVGNFYDAFSREMAAALGKMGTGSDCELCGGKMVMKQGRFGFFFGCSNYPECRNTKPVDTPGRFDELKAEIKRAAPQPTDKKCEKCGKPLVLREGRSGKFLACTGYPGCRFTRPYIGDFRCPNKGCDGMITKKLTKKRRAIYGCTRYPNCDFISWYPPVEETCPKCGTFLIRKKTKTRLVFQCASPECGSVAREQTAPDED